MFKKQHLALAIAATLAAGAAQAALETSVTLKNETAYMTSDSIRTGEATSTTDTTGEGKGVYKFENTAKIFLNDELDNGMSWHGELNIVRDTKAINDYQGHETNTQRDWLRELYVDTTVGDWDLRLGKQQVVWGTADGIKLLDMINPTDWSEFNQNAPADARIPVWMVNAEKYLEDGANIQVVLSQAEQNKIAGLNASGDQGHPFVMKGVDSITGKVNGFLNIGPAMGKVATFFASFPGSAGTLATGAASLRGYTETRVIDFVNDYTVQSTTDFNGGGAGNGYWSELDFRGLCNTSGTPTSTYCEPADLNRVTQSTGTFTNAFSQAVTGGSNSDVTNLIDATNTSNSNWDLTNPNSMFEFMDQTTFATFAAFANMQTEFRTTSMPDNTDANLAFRYRNTLANGMNYSFNYAYNYDANPYIDLHWEDASDGSRLYVKETTVTAPTTGRPADEYTTIALYKEAALTNVHKAETDGAAKLVFDQKLQRVNNLGGSFDYAIDATSAPIVLRGEFLYQKDVKTPVINKAKLRIGNITEALKSEEADFFKYVIGADTTVATDMMLSGQFIQFRNLDYVDETVNATSTNDYVSGARYTADAATLHLSNGLQKAEKNKNFYSLFASKPFGDSGEGRWNNIFIYEEGGGKWNRFDVEYGFDDQLIGTFEVNKYFGDKNTMFGQFENASNIQVGIKYLLQ